MMSHRDRINVFTPLPIDMNSDLSTNSQIMRLPEHARDFYFKTFKHKGFNHGLNELRQCHKLSGLDGQGCIILGHPGMGKSRLLRYFATEVYQQPQYQATDEVTKLPLLSIRVPGKPTILGIIEKLMDCARYEHPTPRNTNIAIKQLYRFIRFTGTEIIIFDEFQHLLKRNALIRTRDVMAFIKVLMDDLCLSVVFTLAKAVYLDISDVTILFENKTFPMVNKSFVGNHKMMFTKIFNMHFITGLIREFVKTPPYNDGYLTITAESRNLSLHLCQYGDVLNAVLTREFKGYLCSTSDLSQVIVPEAPFKTWLADMLDTHCYRPIAVVDIIKALNCTDADIRKLVQDEKLKWAKRQRKGEFVDGTSYMTYTNSPCDNPKKNDSESAMANQENLEEVKAVFNQRDADRKSSELVKKI